MRIVLHRSVAGICAALMLAGCAGSATTMATSGSGAPAAGVTAGRGSSPSPVAAAPRSGAPQPGGGSGTASPPRADEASRAGSQPSQGDTIRVTLGQPCVAPGGEQTITITVSGGAASVTFTTHYAGGAPGTQDGGVGIGTTDATGLYRSAWRVSPEAPPGTASVVAGASRSGATWTAAPVPFTVAASC